MDSTSCMVGVVRSSRAPGRPRICRMAVSASPASPSTTSLTDALTATIAAELGETAAGSTHYQALFTIGIFLFVITFIINLAADLVVRGVRKG